MTVEPIENGCVRVWLTDTELQEWGLDQLQPSSGRIRRLIRQVSAAAGWSGPRRVTAEMIPVDGGGVLLVSPWARPPADTPSVYHLQDGDVLLDLLRQWRYITEENPPTCLLYGGEEGYYLATYATEPLSHRWQRLLTEYGYAAEECLHGLPALCDRLSALVEEQGMTLLLTDVEQPLALVLADMERQGVAVDREGIAAFGSQLTARILTLQKEIYEQVGYEFNLNSPKQLGKALFEDLGLPHGKKTKTGYSTGADVLEKLRDQSPVVANLLEYRTLSKLNSTYCDGLLKVVGPDGRVRSVFNQTETRTGRISSSEPNLQNIPVRSELGRQMRRFFTARPDWVLCDADYSQIELRVLAHMAAEPTMTEAFNTGVDIHRQTAASVFGVAPDQVTAQMRSAAKAVNFGIIYGQGAYSLAEDLDIGFAEAKDYIDRYLTKFGAVNAFMEGLIAAATEKGYGETLLGRRRPLPELKAGNAMTRHFGERVARNMPIQGTAADIIKVAMVRVYRRLQAEGLQARLILQVHDELMVECPREEADTVCRLLVEEMEAAADLTVRLEVDAHVGDTWYDAKG